jgi:hypothetical protein
MGLMLNTQSSSSFMVLVFLLHFKTEMFYVLGDLHDCTRIHLTFPEMYIMICFYICIEKV